LTAELSEEDAIKLKTMLYITHNNHSTCDIDMKEEPPDPIDSDDGEGMDMGDLDLNSIVMVCKQKYPNSIPKNQV
jgi:hypothetical protein